MGSDLGMAGDAQETTPKSLRRRELLVAGAAAGLTLAAPINYAALARGKKLPLAKEGKFATGVMAGVPASDRITLWTRLGEINRSSRLQLEIATDRKFNNVVRRKQVVAEKSRGFTVHSRVKGLKPHEDYYYRFATKEADSPVGHFRTAPPDGSKEKVRIGFVSCQDYEAGFFNAQAALAKEDLDLVVCLGDYIYETSFFSDGAVRADGTGDDNNGDAQRLREYREKYAFYQADPDLKAMHAAHPFVTIFDDHEVEDNYAGDNPDEANGSEDQTKVEGGMGPRRVPYLQRRINGYRAFFEAMPRLRPKKAELSRIYGSIRLGSQCELFFLDERQYRDPQPCDDALFNPCAEYNQPRTLLGEAQRNWLKKGVVDSQANWKVLANQVVMMSLDSAQGVHINPDQWDGYQFERAELLEHFLANQTKNIAVITGDIHTFFAGKVTTNGNNSGTPVATEFVGGSATSPGIPEALGTPPETLALLAAQNQHVTYSNFESRGFGILELDSSGAMCEFKGVNAKVKGAPATTLAKFSVADGVPGAQQV